MVSNDEGQIEYDEVPIEAVMKFWLDNYKPKKGQRIISKEWFYDPTKGKVIFRLYISKQEGLVT